MRIGLGVVLLLAGCDRLFAFETVPAAANDANGSARDATHDGIAADAPDDGLAFDASKPGVKLVQQATNENIGTGLDVALPGAMTNGNTLVVIGGAACGLNVISGGGVGNWRKAASSLISPTIYVYYGITDGSPASVRLVPQCMEKTWGLLTEWHGLTTDPFDTMTQSGATGSTPGTLQMAVYPTAPDLLIFGISSYGPLGSPTAEWTELNQVVASSTITQRTWYQVVPVMGQYLASVTYSNDYDAVIGAFKIGP